MRIGIEAQRLFRFRKHGMEVAAREMIRALQEIDKENEYFVFVRDDVDRCIEDTPNFKIVSVKGPNYPWWEQVELPLAARKYELDILHCTSETAPLIGSIPMVITIHDIIYLESLNFSGTTYQNFGNLYRRFIVPKGVAKSRKIITVSDFERNTIIQKLGISPDRIERVYNGLNPEFRVIDDPRALSDVQQRYKVPSEFILFLGNYAPRKNMKNVIRAFCQYQNGNSGALPLVVLNIPKSHIHELLGDSNSESLGDKIFVTKYVAKEDLPGVYNLAKLLMYPSLREGFGMPILESMQCGTPVITSQESSMPEIAGGAAVLVDPYQRDDIANKMNQVLQNSKLYEEKVQAGLNRAANFSWDLSARKLISIYDQLEYLK